MTPIAMPAFAPGLRVAEAGAADACSAVASVGVDVGAALVTVMVMGDAEVVDEDEDEDEVVDEATKREIHQSPAC